MTALEKQKRLVIVGATGMVGGYALRYALAHPAVELVTTIGRRKIGVLHLFPARDMSLDSDGFPLSAPPAAGHSGLPQPEGPDLGPWREEEGVLRNAEILSGTSVNSAEVD
jgi:hypothetical protein